jgi:hypothetical protein
VLADWLFVHPGWWRRSYLCKTLGVDGRELRRLAADSGGVVVFSSDGRRGGLAHRAHATEDEIRRCAADLRSRAGALQDRAAEVEGGAGV